MRRPSSEVRHQSAPGQWKARRLVRGERSHGRQRRDRHRRRRAHAGRLVRRRLRRRAGPRTRRHGDQGRAGARQGLPRRRRRGDLRPGPHRGRRPEPGPSGGDQGRHPREGHRLGPQPGLRLGPAHGRHRHAADRQRRRQRHRGGRPGIDVALAPRAVPARRPEDGRPQARRHHDQGRALGRLQRLPHGPDRRERRPGLPAHPRAAGPVRDRARRTRPRPPGRRAGSRTRSSR